MIICFYIGRECRYGQDAAPEEQMECSSCPAYAMWQMMRQDVGKKSENPTDKS